MIVGISGKRGTGKTTLANILAEKYGFEHRYFAQTLKEMIKQQFNLTDDHVHGVLKEALLTGFPGWTPRKLMIAVGQFYRSIDELYWVKKTLQDDGQLNHIVVSDVRFPNEAKVIKNLGGIIVRLNRALDLNIYQGEITDPSETALDDYPDFDIIIPALSNETMDDMYDTAAFVSNAVFFKEAENGR